MIIIYKQKQFYESILNASNLHTVIWFQVFLSNNNNNNNLQTDLFDPKMGP